MLKTTHVLHHGPRLQQLVHDLCPESVAKRSLRLLHQFRVLSLPLEALHSCNRPGMHLVKNFAALLVFDDLEVLALSDLLATQDWKIS